MDKLPVLLVSLAIVGLLFLALREVVCWYWKINRGMALLEEQTKLLKEIRDAAFRSEQNGLDHEAARLRERVAASAPLPPPLR